LEDLLDLGIHSWDVHVLEKSLKLIQIHLSRLVSISLPEERVESLPVLVESHVYSIKYTLLHADDFLRDLVNGTTIAALLLLIIQSELIALEDTKESRIVNASLLVSPEVIDELVNLLLINVRKFHAGKHSLEFVTRYGTAFALVKQAECL
jgi:hypothetical protein